MSIRAVFVDFGGVIMRTEDTRPRTRLAELLGMPVRELEKVIFESETSRQASLGEITEKAHWQAVANALGASREKIDEIHAAFFAGDQVNEDLLGYLGSLRPVCKIGLISNAWSGMRNVIERLKFAGIFDELIISAEVGLMKPDVRIYRLALERVTARPEESVFVDDMLVNVEAARSIGMNAIHFTQPEHALDELKRLLSDHR